MSTITAATTTHTTSTAESRLRAVLHANAATSLLGGAIGLAATDRVVDGLGLGNTTWTSIVSASLVLFALGIVLGTRSGRVRTTALLASAGDAAWLAGTVALLAAVDVTGVGQVVALVLGIGVLDFAALQLWYGRRVER